MKKRSGFNPIIYIFVLVAVFTAFGAAGIFSERNDLTDDIVENETQPTEISEYETTAGNTNNSDNAEISKKSEDPKKINEAQKESEPVTTPEPATEVLSSEPLSENNFLYDFVEKYIDIAMSENRDPQGAGGYTKYGEYFGSANAQWCTEFAMWCIIKADEELGTNYAEAYFPCKDSAYQCVKWHEKNGTLRLKQNYIPRKGDIIYFDYDYDENCDHTGLVTGVERDSSDGKIYILTIEGNLPEDYPDGVIRERSLAADSRIIYGYGTFKAQE